MNEMNVVVVSTMSEWQGLQNSWVSIYSQSSTQSFFLTWEWVDSWVECYLEQNRSLYVLVISEKGKEVGVAPFYINQKRSFFLSPRVIRLLGNPDAGSDYLDVLSIKGREKKVANAVYDYLFGAGKNMWDVLEFNDVPANSNFLLHFTNRIEFEGKYTETRLGAYCPVVQLAGSRDDLIAGLSKSWKKKFKQDVRVANRDHSVEHMVLEGQEAVAELHNFFDLYERKSGWKTGTLLKLMKIYSRKCGGAPMIQLDIMTMDDERVGALLHFKHHKTLLMYLMAVNKEFNSKLSIGNLLVGQCLIQSIEKGYRFYDFLKGDEGYKFHWANAGERSVQLNFWQKRPAGLFSGFSVMGRNMLKMLIR